MKKPSFESALAELERIVREMESKDLPLEVSLKKFEEGMRLSRLCAEKLEEVKKKVTILMSDNDSGVREEPFTAADEVEE